MYPLTTSTFYLNKLYIYPSKFFQIHQLEKMKSIVVFCGSSSGSKEIFTKQTHLLGQALAKRDITLIYGGAKIGLMGSVADGALAENGKVIGVLPEFLGSKEIAHNGLSELIMVKSMHERKTKMSELCEAVIALPGGYGTMEEVFEMLTWGQLGLHKKAIGILNIDGFYDTLAEQIQKMVDSGFLKEVNQKMLLISNNIDDLLTKMDAYVAPQVGKWIKQENT